MNGSGVSSRISAEGAPNGTDDDVVAQAVCQVVADGALLSSERTNNTSEEGPCPAFLKFLECDLVVDQLMQFLNFEEMKVLCLVSKDMLAVVMRTREFQKRSLFDINKDPATSEPEVDLHNRFPFSWKYVAFDVSLPVRVVEQFADKLKCVESLVLYYKYKDPEVRHRHHKPEELSASSVAECCIRIHEILSTTISLRELQLEMFLLGYPLNETLSTRKVQRSISNLESLIVNGSYYAKIDSVESTHFHNNLLQLSRCPLNKLKQFFMSCADPEVDSIVEIVKAFKETLEELILNHSIWQLQEMKAIRCPQLKNLITGIDEENIEALSEFVEKQPLLEDLCLVVHTILPAKDLKCFRGRLQNLRKFEYLLDHDCKPDIEITEVDWTFLGTMTKLEDFAVQIPYGGRGPEMIDHIPDKVEKLGISCQFREADFWSGSRHLEDFSPNIGSHLKRLKNLTHLSLTRCADAVNDIGLQTIIKTLPNLIELKLKKCAELTDFGISGVNGNDGVNEREPGVPLSHLKGLVELEISECDLVTPACILTVVQFKYLESFTFDTSAENGIQDMDQFASQIQEQNPRLILLKHNGNKWVKNGLLWSHELSQEEGG